MYDHNTVHSTEKWHCCPRPGTKRCVVVAIVDVFDFHGSLVPDLSTVLLRSGVLRGLEMHFRSEKCIFSLRFKMLIAIALSPRSDEEEQEDTAALFDFFDDDGSGHISLDEVME